jgi:hypothetical protein
MNTNRYDPMPADYGDDGETVALVGAGKATETEPVTEDKSENSEEKPPVKKAAGRPKKAVAVSEDEQGTTAKN